MMYLGACCKLYDWPLFLCTGARQDLDKAIELSHGQGKAACQAYTQRALLRRREGKCFCKIKTVFPGIGMQISGFPLGYCVCKSHFREI